MKTLKEAFLSVILALTLGLVVTGCDNGTTSDGGTPPNFEAPLKAVAVAASTSAPKVLDSYTDGINNYYLIDVGYISNAYISTILSAHYNGATPMSTSRTTINETTVSNSITKIVSTSITTSDTQSHTAGIEAAWKKQFPVVGEFSAKLKYEWTGSWTNSKTDTTTIETSSSTVERYADSITNSFTIGEHGEPAGSYRYASYAVCDVYFVVITNLDNSQLVSWDTVVSVREDTLGPHMDYSSNGIFDNSPENGNIINFSDDFFKTLPVPIKEKPPVETSKTIRLNDQGEIECKENSGNKYTEYYRIGLDFAGLKAAGYKTINIEGSFDVRVKWDLDKGAGRDVWLDVDGAEVWKQTNYNIDSTSWRKKTFIKSVPIDSFNNESKARFGFWTKDVGLFSNSAWYFGTAHVTFTAIK